MLLPSAAGERSLLAVDAPDGIVEAVKPAENGSGHVIVRLNESKRMATRRTLITTLPLRQAVQTGMLERAAGALPRNEAKIPLTFRPFEIKTVRLVIESRT